MTGREHCNIQRTIVAAIVGAAPDGFVRAIRAVVEFIYFAQNPVHTETSIKILKATLQDFHANKHFSIEVAAWRTNTGVKSDFNIPKLELFQSFATAIHTVGSLIQHTTDVSEQLLVTHCKHTFEWTSHNCNSFTEQIIHLFDHKERMYLFNVFTLLWSHNISLINSATDLKQSHAMYVDPTLAWIQEVLPSKQMCLMGPPRCHAPNMFGTMDIGIMSPAFRKLKSFFKNIFIGLKHLELRKRKIADIIPCTGYYESKKGSDANNMTVQQYYCEMYNIHIK